MGVRRTNKLIVSLITVWVISLSCLPLSTFALDDPALAIPFTTKPPVIDGKIEKEEWQYAAVVSMFEAYPCYVPRVMRQEQPLVYIMWDAKYIYIAFDCVESNTNTIVARCALNDNLRIIGDDCVELMMAPGAGKALDDMDFPTLYMAYNSIGTLWDAKFKVLRNETHNSWQSDAKIANIVEGTHWSSEVRIPISSITVKPVKNGDVWRMNFDRTYFGYNWSAWIAGGGLNDARNGGDVTFTDKNAVARLISTDELVAGKLRITMEIANPTQESRKVTLNLLCQSEMEKGAGLHDLSKQEISVDIEPGKIKEVAIGKGQRLERFNTISIRVTDGGKQQIFFLQRQVDIPVIRMAKKAAPVLPLVYVFPRFLPSLERLAVVMDCIAWLKKNELADAKFTAEINVYAKNNPKQSVLSGKFSDFKKGKGVWRTSTEKLPEGEYTVNVKVSSDGKELISYDDWFEKRIFPWMKKKFGVTGKVPKPYTALKTKGLEVKSWGRVYSFSKSGMLDQIESQQKPLLNSPMSIEAEVDGKKVDVTTDKNFTFNQTKPDAVKGNAVLNAGDLGLQITAITEYDGFVLYKLRYGPAKGSKEVNLNRLRVRVPLKAEYIKFYSASGDTQGVNILGDKFPEKQGKVYDSITDTRSVSCSPSFSTLFWVGDYDTCFCYAADSDKGWKISDDLPAVEAWRKGSEVSLYLNLVNRPVIIKDWQELEFGFQAGPTKPRPKAWRGIQDGGDETNALITRREIGGSGVTLLGGSNFLYPGSTKEFQEKSRKKIAGIIKKSKGKVAVAGYHYWGTVPKGLAETRVFRGEWGIDKFTWDAAKKVTWAWPQRLFGDNKGLYIIMHANCVPSYVDFVSYAYDQSLKCSELMGFYDDTGYPKPVYDEELGIGYKREDGRKVFSSNLWTYRDRWKRAAQINDKYGRENFLSDSQHVHAHFMPAYGFIGCWAPCEHGYYNPFKDRDNLGFYNSLERYVAHNPSKQFGQVPMIGMSTPQWNEALSNRDTRCMMMMALLNDQDVGSFGRRNGRTVCRMRRARNVFRQWEEGVTFHGYWGNKNSIKVDNKDFLVSYYQRAGSVLFVIGNIGDKDSSAMIKPNWKILKIDPAKIELVNPETGKKMPIQDNAFKISLSKHDLALVIASAPNSYPEAFANLVNNSTTNLSRAVKRLSSPLAKAPLGDGWEKVLHKGNSAVGFVDGKMYIQGHHYGYAYIKHKLGIKDFTVQCQILRKRSGCADNFGGSLFLWWDNGAFIQVGPGTRQGKFFCSESGRIKYGKKINKKSLPGWYPYLANWVKLKLTPEKIIFYSSIDGKNWEENQVIKRTGKYAGAPDFLMLGNGKTGKNPYLSNVLSKHFNPDRPSTTFYSDLVVQKN